MYYAEWLMWQVCIEAAEDRVAMDASAENEDRDVEVYESDLQLELEESRRKVSDAPRLHSPVYVYNDAVLELRCGMFEAWRGLATLLTFVVWLVVLSGILIASNILLAALATEEVESILSAMLSLTVGVIFPTAISFASAWVYLKYGFRLSRLEMLTSRHLLIRFNRKTRQVYLHRPKYCGGIVVLPWEGITSGGASLDAAESSDMGSPLSLMWPPQSTGLPHMECAMVGPQARGYSELRHEWEFIRRFMEDGPQDLPQPKLTSHFPWPWQGFIPQLEMMGHQWRYGNGLTQWGVVLMSPAYVCLGLLHWLSLLLCWKPRWPKIIREAGLPGKPVPPFTTLADYPPDIQARLLANADRWALIPGARPEKPLADESGGTDE